MGDIETKKNQIIKEIYNLTKDLENIILKTKDTETKLKLIDVFSEFIANNSTGCFAYPQIDKELINIANQIPFEIPQEKNEKTLIVMSESYKTGGHTRVVEKLIEHSKENRFDLFFTWNRFKPIDSLVEICGKKYCNVIVTKYQDILETAIYLRNIASKYKNILLFVHPEDISWIIAFGHEKWNVPISLYNHAEHRPWLGGTLLDAIIDFSNIASTNSKYLRGIENTEIVPLPLYLNKSSNKTNKELLKDELRIDKNKKVILSGGSPYKLEPFGNLDMRNIVDAILNNFDNVIYIIVGVPTSHKLWQDLLNKYKDKLILMEQIPYPKFLNLYKISDIVIDSVPVGGFTFILEALAFNVPVITFNFPLSYPSQLKKFEINFSIDEIIKKVDEYLNSEGLNIDISFEENDPDYFVKRIDEVLAKYLAHNIREIIEINLDFNWYNLSHYTLFTIYKNKINLTYKTIYNQLPLIYKLKISKYIEKYSLKIQEILSNNEHYKYFTN